MKRATYKIMAFIGIFFILVALFTLMWIMIRLMGDNQYQIQYLQTDILRAIPLAIVSTIGAYLKYRLVINKQNKSND